MIAIAASTVWQTGDLTFYGIALLLTVAAAQRRNR